MPVLLHDYMAITDLPLRFREHLAPACLAAKEQDGNTRCSSFCGAGGEVEAMVEKRPEGCLHQCPFEQLKIAVPIFSGALLGGILFAGPAHPEMKDQWLEGCHTLLRAVACQVEQLTRPEDWRSDQLERKQQVLVMLNRHLERPARLVDLAEELNLSPSRARHLVVELFGKPFRALSLEIRLRRAAGFLRLSDAPIAEVAWRYGFCDQSHFTKAFKAFHGTTPHAFRHGPARGEHPD